MKKDSCFQLGQCMLPWKRDWVYGVYGSKKNGSCFVQVKTANLRKNAWSRHIAAAVKCAKLQGRRQLQYLVCDCPCPCPSHPSKLPSHAHWGVSLVAGHLRSDRWHTVTWTVDFLILSAQFLWVSLTQATTAATKNASSKSANMTDDQRWWSTMPECYIEWSLWADSARLCKTPK